MRYFRRDKEGWASIADPTSHKQTEIIKQLFTCLSIPGFDFSLRIKKRVKQNWKQLLAWSFKYRATFKCEFLKYSLEFIKNNLWPKLKCWSALFYVKFTTDLLNLGRLRYIHSVCLWYPYVIIILSCQATGPRRTYFLVEN